MLKKILIALLLCLPIAVNANSIFYIKVNNKSNYDASISLGKESENWECGDFCKNEIVPAVRFKD